MANQNPQIVGSVRIGRTTFVAGQEDQLAKAASSGEIDRLTEKGVIAGFSSKASKSKAASEPAPEAAPAVEAAPETTEPAAGIADEIKPKGTATKEK